MVRIDINIPWCCGACDIEASCSRRVNGSKRPDDCPLKEIEFIDEISDQTLKCWRDKQ